MSFTVPLVLKVTSRQAVKELGRVKDGLDDVAVAARGANSQLSNALKTLLSWSSLRTGFDVGKSLTKAASDFQEAEGKFKQVFQHLTGEADAMAEELVRNFNFSKKEAIDSLSTMADIFNKTGLSLRKSLDYAFDLNKRAADLEAFTNAEGGLEQTTKALTNVMLGFGLRAQHLGVVVNKTAVNLQEAKNAANGMRFETPKAAQAFARYQMIMRQSASAMGQVAREHDNYANRLRTLRARFLDLKQSLGETFIEPATKVVDALSAMAKAASETSLATRTTIAAVSTLGPITLGLVYPLGLASAAFKYLMGTSGAATTALGAEAKASDRAATAAATGAKTVDRASKVESAARAKSAKAAAAESKARVASDAKVRASSKANVAASKASVAASKAEEKQRAKARAEAAKEAAAQKAVASSKKNANAVSSAAVAALNAEAAARRANAAATEAEIDALKKKNAESNYKKIYKSRPSSLTPKLEYGGGAERPRYTVLTDENGNLPSHIVGDVRQNTPAGFVAGEINSTLRAARGNMETAKRFQKSHNGVIATNAVERRRKWADINWKAAGLENADVGSYLGNEYLRDAIKASGIKSFGEIATLEKRLRDSGEDAFKGGGNGSRAALTFVIQEMKDFRDAMATGKNLDAFEDVADVLGAIYSGDLRRIGETTRAIYLENEETIANLTEVEERSRELRGDVSQIKNRVKTRAEAKKTNATPATNELAEAKKEAENAAKAVELNERLHKAATESGVVGVDADAIADELSELAGLKGAAEKHIEEYDKEISAIRAKLEKDSSSREWSSIYDRVEETELFDKILSGEVSREQVIQGSKEYLKEGRASKAWARFDELDARINELDKLSPDEGRPSETEFAELFEEKQKLLHEAAKLDDAERLARNFVDDFDEELLYIKERFISNEDRKKNEDRLQKLIELKAEGASYVDGLNKEIEARQKELEKIADLTDLFKDSGKSVGDVVDNYEETQKELQDALADANKRIEEAKKNLKTESDARFARYDRESRAAERKGEWYFNVGNEYDGKTRGRYDKLTERGLYDKGAALFSGEAEDVRKGLGNDAPLTKILQEWTREFHEEANERLAKANEEARKETLADSGLKELKKMLGRSVRRGSTTKENADAAIREKTEELFKVKLAPKLEEMRQDKEFVAKSFFAQETVPYLNRLLNAGNLENKSDFGVKLNDTVENGILKFLEDYAEKRGEDLERVIGLYSSDAKKRSFVDSNSDISEFDRAFYEMSKLFGFSNGETIPSDYSARVRESMLKNAGFANAKPTLEEENEALRKQVEVEKKLDATRKRLAEVRSYKASLDERFDSVRNDVGNARNARRDRWFTDSAEEKLIRNELLAGISDENIAALADALQTVTGRSVNEALLLSDKHLEQIAKYEAQGYGKFDALKNELADLALFSGKLSESGFEHLVPAVEEQIKQLEKEDDADGSVVDFGRFLLDALKGKEAENEDARFGVGFFEKKTQVEKELENLVEIVNRLEAEARENWKTRYDEAPSKLRDEILDVKNSRSYSNSFHEQGPVFDSIVPSVPAPPRGPKPPKGPDGENVIGDDELYRRAGTLRRDIAYSSNLKKEKEKERVENERRAKEEEAREAKNAKYRRVTGKSRKLNVLRRYYAQNPDEAEEALVSKRAAAIASQANREEADRYRTSSVDVYRKKAKTAKQAAVMAKNAVEIAVRARVDEANREFVEQNKKLSRKYARANKALEDFVEKENEAAKSLGELSENTGLDKIEQQEKRLDSLKTLHGGREKTFGWETVSARLWNKRKFRDYGATYETPENYMLKTILPNVFEKLETRLREERKAIDAELNGRRDAAKANYESSVAAIVSKYQSLIRDASFFYKKGSAEYDRYVKEQEYQRKVKIEAAGSSYQDELAQLRKDAAIKRKEHNANVVEYENSKDAFVAKTKYGLDTVNSYSDQFFFDDKKRQKQQFDYLNNVTAGRNAPASAYDVGYEAARLWNNAVYNGQGWVKQPRVSPNDYFNDSIVPQMRGILDDKVRGEKSKILNKRTNRVTEARSVRKRAKAEIDERLKTRLVVLKAAAKAEANKSDEDVIRDEFVKERQKVIDKRALSSEEVASRQAAIDERYRKKRNYIESRGSAVKSRIEEEGKTRTAELFAVRDNIKSRGRDVAEQFLNELFVPMEKGGWLRTSWDKVHGESKDSAIGPTWFDFENQNSIFGDMKKNRSPFARRVFQLWDQIKEDTPSIKTIDEAGNEVRSYAIDREKTKKLGFDSKNLSTQQIFFKIVERVMAEGYSKLDKSTIKAFAAIQEDVKKGVAAVEGAVAQSLASARKERNKSTDRLFEEDRAKRQWSAEDDVAFEEFKEKRNAKIEKKARKEARNQIRDEVEEEVRGRVRTAKRDARVAAYQKSVAPVSETIAKEIELRKTAEFIANNKARFADDLADYGIAGSASAASIVSTLSNVKNEETFAPLLDTAKEKMSELGGEAFDNVKDAATDKLSEVLSGDSGLRDSELGKTLGAVVDEKDVGEKRKATMAALRGSGDKNVDKEYQNIGKLAAKVATQNDFTENQRAAIALLGEAGFASNQIADLVDKEGNLSIDRTKLSKEQLEALDAIGDDDVKDAAKAVKDKKLTDDEARLKARLANNGVTDEALSEMYDKNNGKIDLGRANAETLNGINATAVEARTPQESKRAKENIARSERTKSVTKKIKTGSRRGWKNKLGIFSAVREFRGSKAGKAARVFSKKARSRARKNKFAAKYGTGAKAVGRFGLDMGTTFFASIGKVGKSISNLGLKVFPVIGKSAAVVAKFAKPVGIILGKAALGFGVVATATIGALQVLKHLPTWFESFRAEILPKVKEFGGQIIAKAGEALVGGVKWLGDLVQDAAVGAFQTVARLRGFETAASRAYAINKQMEAVAERRERIAEIEQKALAIEELNLKLRETVAEGQKKRNVAKAEVSDDETFALVKARNERKDIEYRINENLQKANVAKANADAAEQDFNKNADTVVALKTAYNKVLDNKDFSEEESRVLNSIGLHSGTKDEFLSKIDETLKLYEDEGGILDKNRESFQAATEAQKEAQKEIEELNQEAEKKDVEIATLENDSKNRRLDIVESANKYENEEDKAYRERMKAAEKKEEAAQSGDKTDYVGLDAALKEQLALVQNRKTFAASLRDENGMASGALKAATERLLATENGDEKMAIVQDVVARRNAGYDTTGDEEVKASFRNERKEAEREQATLIEIADSFESLEDEEARLQKAIEDNAKEVKANSETLKKTVDERDEAEKKRLESLQDDAKEARKKAYSANDNYALEGMSDEEKLKYYGKRRNASLDLGKTFAEYYKTREKKEKADAEYKEVENEFYVGGDGEKHATKAKRNAERVKERAEDKFDSVVKTLEDEYGFKDSEIRAYERAKKENENFSKKQKGFKELVNGREVERAPEALTEDETKRQSANDEIIANFDRKVVAKNSELLDDQIAAVSSIRAINMERGKEQISEYVGALQRSLEEYSNVKKEESQAVGGISGVQSGTSEAFRIASKIYDRNTKTTEQRISNIEKYCQNVEKTLTAILAGQQQTVVLQGSW